MRIKDLKEYKTRLHRLVRYMLGAELVLGFLVSLAYANYFKKITGRDYDLLWFVEQKMRYNDLRPRLNGRKY